MIWELVCEDKQAGTRTERLRVEGATLYCRYVSASDGAHPPIPLGHWTQWDDQPEPAQAVVWTNGEIQ